MACLLGLARSVDLGYLRMILNGNGEVLRSTLWRALQTTEEGGR